MPEPDRMKACSTKAQKPRALAVIALLVFLLAGALFLARERFSSIPLRRGEPTKAKTPAAVHSKAGAAEIGERYLKAAKALGNSADSEIELAHFKEGFRFWLKNASPKDFTLTEAEFDALARQTLAFTKLCGELKFDAPKTVSRNGDTITIALAARPDVAVATWKEFNIELAKTLSPEAADRIDDAIGWRIASLLNGYGDVDEVYQIAPMADHPGRYTYTYTATRPLGVSGDAAVICGHFAGASESGNAPLPELLSMPNYAFLGPLLK